MLKSSTSSFRVVDSSGTASVSSTETDALKRGGVMDFVGPMFSLSGNKLARSSFSALSSSSSPEFKVR